MLKNLQNRLSQLQKQFEEESKRFNLLNLERKKTEENLFRLEGAIQILHEEIEKGTELKNKAMEGKKNEKGK